MSSLETDLDYVRYPFSHDLLFAGSLLFRLSRIFISKVFRSLDVFQRIYRALCAIHD
jgi:hypothetical protein